MIISVHRPKDMSPKRVGFCIPFCLSLKGLFVLIFLTACQPLIQAQIGSQTKIPVSAPHQNYTITSAEQNQPIEPASTTLTAEDIAAAPLHADTKSGEKPVNKPDIKETEQPTIKITRSSEPETPTIKPTFNPADLVGRTNSYVSSLFGQADFKRTEGVIHVLQYLQPDCVIDLFINIASKMDVALSPDAKVSDWAMRERTINQPLNQTLCKQQFYERKL